MPVALVCRPRRWHMCMDEKQLCIMLSSIMLSEISQAVRDKYHMISPLTGTQATKEKKKKLNITRDTEIENNLAVTTGETGGHNGGKGEK